MDFVPAAAVDLGAAFADVVVRFVVEAVLAVEVALLFVWAFVAEVASAVAALVFAEAVLTGATAA